MKFDFKETTIAKFHKALLLGEVTCKELTEYYLKRIDTYDKKGPCLNSIILINPNALKEAEELDKNFKETGKLSGSLFGVPVILKDNVDTFDMQTTAGSASLEGFVPDDDAFLAKKLREAGAIIIAKSNLHEFAIWGETISSILGQTLNPYDLTRTPGGSSGGTGAALAADFGLVGIGTDTINSIRSPSSACSLVGIRPTIGLVSRDGVVPYSFTQDTAGPICRTVEDAVAVLDAIDGYDIADSETAWCVDKLSKYADYLNKDALKGKRIGVLRSFFGNDTVHEEVNKAMAPALKKLFDLGAEVVDIKENIDSGYLTSSISVHLHDLKDHLNVYLNALPARAPVHSVDDVMNSGKYHPGIKDNMEKAMQLSVGTPEYNQRLVLRSELQTQVMKIMADYNIDAIVYPHQQQLVCETGKGQQQRNGALCSVTGFPSIAVPAGFSTPTEEAPIGVPVGMEIIGRPWSEPILISIAYSFEQSIPVRQSPKSTL